MDSTNQNQSGFAPTPRQQIDFGAMKAPAPSSSQSSNPSSTISQSTPSISEHFQPKVQPTPVTTSAKAAINAMYAEQANQPSAAMVMSAREAVNAAAQQAGIQHTKSAANLHHGSIQRSMESTRTSASALLRRAGDELKVDSTHADSQDPLTKVRLASSQKRPEREIPVVRTSLKLGASARPKPAPVVLPPNARMAQVARPVNSPRPTSSKLAKLLRHSATDAQVIPKSSLASKSLASGADEDDNALTVTIVPTSSTSKSSSSISKRSNSTTKSSAISLARPKRKNSAIRDPQMLSGARRSLKNRAQSFSHKAQAAEALGMPSAHSARFRSKPKDFSAQQPSALPMDNSYIMAEPPKLQPKKKTPASENLGIVESYRPENPPQLIGDKAPTGSVHAQKVASGHVGATPEAPAIKADNTSNYSFSKPKSDPDNNRYALGGESPFLRSVNVEKRPLSNSPKKLNPKVERAAMKAVEPAKPATKPGRKNHYTKKTNAPTPHQELPTRPTVIVPSNRRSKAPLVFLILITVILGGAVGAAVYLCFFQ